MEMTRKVNSLLLSHVVGIQPQHGRLSSQPEYIARPESSKPAGRAAAHLLLGLGSHTGAPGDPHKRTWSSAVRCCTWHSSRCCSCNMTIHIPAHTAQTRGTYAFTPDGTMFC